MTTTPQAWPGWYDGRHINEVLFTVWALRWSIRRRIENKKRTSKVPYTPYTLYGCF